MNTLTRILAPGLAALVLSGCVIDARNRDTLIEPVRYLDEAVEEGAPIRVRIPAAVVNLENSDDGRLRGEMRILCPSLDSHCAEKLGDNAFVTEEVNGEFRLQLKHNGSWRYRNAEVHVDLWLPEGNPVFIDLTAGELDAKLANCVRADVEAGDVSFELPISIVSSVELDAGLGDAGLYIDGRWIDGHRSLLVGAEAEWSGGDGDCEVDIDLQAGDLRLELVGASPRRSSQRITDGEAE
ncbi:MAG: hypothetical protein AAGE01_19665 [Pseudomonadota bacterium]